VVDQLATLKADHNFTCREQSQPCCLTNWQLRLRAFAGEAQKLVANSGPPPVTRSTLAVKPSSPIAQPIVGRRTPGRAKLKAAATHVDAFVDISRDAGSIPAASTLPAFDRWRRTASKPLACQGFWRFLVYSSLPADDSESRPKPREMQRPCATVFPGRRGAAGSGYRNVGPRLGLVVHPNVGVLHRHPDVAVLTVLSTPAAARITIHANIHSSVGNDLGGASANLWSDANSRFPERLRGSSLQENTRFHASQVDRLALLQN
jgi:hypothetical protein